MVHVNFTLHGTRRCACRFLSPEISRNTFSLTNFMQTHGLRILLIDNDVNDQFLSQLALEKALPAGSVVHAVHSGDEAVAYMIGEKEFSNREVYPFPSLVITDLHMPNGDGFDVLEFLQNNPAWNVVPRLMFSSSDDADDVRTAYMLGASAYHIKPLALSDMEARMRSIVEYWAGSQVPPVDRTGRVLPTNSVGRLGARYPKPLPGGAAMQRP
jgi:DNA-binding response OmpR family regulator